MGTTGSRFAATLAGLALLAAMVSGSPAAPLQEERAGVGAGKPRVEPIPVAEMNARQRKLLGIVEGEPLPKRARSNLFRTLMHNPELMAVYMPMGDAVNKSSRIPARQRELVILRIAWLYQGKYEWAQHYEKALASGWTREDIERMKLGANAPGWSNFDRTLLRAVDQLVLNASLEDDVWAALGEQYRVPDIMALITLVTHYHWVAMMTKSLGVEPDNRVQEFGSAATGAKVIHEGAVSFVEGPAWRPDGTVFFTDIPNNRIMLRTPDGVITTHREPSGHANGLVFDGQGRLLAAESDGRIVRELADGSIEVLADTYSGAPFNSPNDLDLDSRGRVYFTDPAYRNRDNARQRDERGEVVDGVYRIDGRRRVARILTGAVDMPNGILVSPGDRYLYVADNDNRAHGVRKLWRFDLDENGEAAVKSRKLIFDWGAERGPDGMAIDVAGNLYVAAGLNTPRPNRTVQKYKAGIYVISPRGELLDFIAIPMDVVSNVTFGGADLRTLFITAGHSLWSVRVDTPGYRP